MFENLGMGELLVILIVVLLLFGSKKIPEIAQGLGKGIREFKKSIKEVEEQITAPNKEISDLKKSFKDVGEQITRSGNEKSNKDITDSNQTKT
jgi:sec-independent protein translocase protein TatA